MFSLKKLLPSKRFFLAILGLGVGVVGLLVFMRAIESGPFSNKEISENLTEAFLSDKENVARLQNISSQDTDGDGLKDWEESLWGTDPALTDTNGDGQSDYGHIQEQRKAMGAVDPMIETSSVSATAGIDTENLTTTDLFARDLFTTVSILSQKGALDDNRDVVANTIVETVTTMPLYTPFVADALQLVALDIDTFKAYGTTMQNIMGQYPLDEQEFALVLNSAADEGVSDPNVTIIEKKYADLAHALETTVVPVPLRDAHIAMINAVRYMHGVIGGIVSAAQDPLIGMAGTYQFEFAFDALIQAYQQWYQLFFE